jgi:hypothetical protein
MERGHGLFIAADQDRDGTQQDQHDTGNTIQAPDLTAVGEFCGDGRAQQARSHDDRHGQRKELRAQRDVADGAGQRDERHNHRDRAGADGDGA